MAKINLIREIQGDGELGEGQNLSQKLWKRQYFFNQRQYHRNNSRLNLQALFSCLFLVFVKFSH